MHKVAIKITHKSREELVKIVCSSNAYFIYINMGLPLSAAHYQEMVSSAKAKYQTSTNEKKAKRIYDEVRRQINSFASRAMLFNHTLIEITETRIDVKLV